MEGLPADPRLLARRADPFFWVGAVRAEKRIEVTAVVPRPTCALAADRLADPTPHLEEPVLGDRLSESLVEVVDSLASRHLAGERTMHATRVLVG